MKLGTLITAASIALLPLTAGAATLIIPAAGTGAGSNNSVWQSEVTLHNISSRSITATLTFHDQNGAAESAVQTVAPRSTVSLQDVVRTSFNRQSGTGAIEITLADSDASQLAVASRTANVTDHGELGQDVPVVKAADAANEGDLAVIAGPSTATAAHLNFGIYAVTDATVRWSVVRADGSEAASSEQTYTAGQQRQYNEGITTLLQSTPQDNDVVLAAVTRGSAILYGSAVDNRSGDPTFVNAARTRIESRIAFAGVDRDNNGSVDIPAHDGQLDRAVETTTYGFPALFRIVASGGDSDTLHFELLQAPVSVDASFVDASKGLLQIAGSAALKGQTIELKVRVVTGSGDSTVLTIPVKFV